MASPTQTPELVPWNSLQTQLGGYLEAHAHGLLRVSYALTDRHGRPCGELRARNARAVVRAGSLEARIEGNPRNGYRMFSNGTELARARPLEESAAALRVECAGRVYEARLRLLRNTAVFRDRGGAETARISGGLAGRRYEVYFDPATGGALLSAVLVLHYMTALRRRIYLAG